jgi:hypothetical protein
MRSTVKEMDKAMESEDYSIREACWGTMHIEHGTFKRTVDVAPLLKGLPGGRCQSDHWGYILKGSIKVKYPDREEVIRAGDTYHIEPNHTGTINAGTEYVEFSPEDRYHETMAAIKGNLEKQSDEP